MNARRCNFRRLGVVVLLSACAQVALGARASIQSGTVREDGAVITATMHKIEQIEVPIRDEPKVVDRAFKFKLHVVEVLYGTDIKVGDVISIDASYGGYGNTWEGGPETRGYGGFGGPLNNPPEGTKIMAYLQPAEDGRRDLFFYPGSVLVVDSFDDPRVEMWRRIARLWAMPASRDLLTALIDGTRSNNFEYQRFCVGALWENRDEKSRLMTNFHAIKLKDVTTPAEIDTAIWKVFIGTDTPLEIVLDCDRFIGHIDRKLKGVWELHPLRHDTLIRATKRYAENQHTVNWQKVGWAMAPLTDCGARADQTRELILELIKLPEKPPSGDFGLVAGSPLHMLAYLSRLYNPDAATVSAEELSKKIVRDLTDLANDPKMGTVALGCICQVVEAHARIGERNQMLIQLIESARKRAQEEEGEEAELRRWTLKNDLERINELTGRARQAIGDTKLPARLSWPFEEQVGKQVYVETRGVGIPAGLWIDETQPRPRADQFPDYWIAIGTLKKYDVPYFELKAGKDFGEGIPIPPEMRAESLAVRYVLEDVSWTAVPHAPVKK